MTLGSKRKGLSLTIQHQEKNPHRSWNLHLRGAGKEEVCHFLENLYLVLEVEGSPVAPCPTWLWLSGGAARGEKERSC